MTVARESEAHKLVPTPRNLLPRPRKLRERLGVSLERMGRLLDVSASTIHRWEAQRRAAPRASRWKRRLAVVDEVVRLGRVVYGERGIPRLPDQPTERVRRLTALQLIERGEEERVLAALASDYEGLGY